MDVVSKNMIQDVILKSIENVIAEALQEEKEKLNVS